MKNKISPIFLCVLFSIAITVHAQPTITTYAGTGTMGYTGDGGSAATATLSGPAGVAVDGWGRVYVADMNNNAIRLIDTTGIITTVAGGHGMGYSGDGGAATAAQISAARAIALDGQTIYIADGGNRVIRKVNGSTGVITTLAGTGVFGYTGDGGPASSATMSSPTGVAMNGANLLIADQGNNVIRSVDLITGTISTFAGTGMAGYSGDGGPATAAKLNQPISIATGNGYAYIVEFIGKRVREIDLSTGTINTFAGTGTGGYSGDGGAATAATINNAEGICVDISGNVFFGDQPTTVREVSGGTINTYAGQALSGFVDNVAATSGKMNGVRGVAADEMFHNIYIADAINNRIRKVDCSSCRRSGHVNSATNVSADNEAVMIVPNPNTGAFNISGVFDKNYSGAADISVTDLSGRTIETTRTKMDHGRIAERISIGANLANGLYIVHVTFNAQARSLRATIIK